MSFQDTWPKADPDAVGGDSDDLTPPPDGTYDVALMDGTAFTAKSSGKDIVKLAWKVVDGPHMDYEWTVLLGFKSQGQANMTKKQMRELGVPIDAVGSLDELNAAIVEKIGHYFVVTVKRDGKFENTYIDGQSTGVQQAITDVPAEAGAAAAGASPEDDDIPFRARFPEMRRIPMSWNPLA